MFGGGSFFGLPSLSQTILGVKEAEKDRGAVSDANAQNIASARAQEAFQERMSSTSHQREIEDLKKAGLNPLLSVNSGASTPSGSMASVSALPSELRNISANVSSARDDMRLRSEVKESNSRQELNRQMAATQVAQGNLLHAHTNSALAMGRINEHLATYMDRRGSFESKFPRIFGVMDALNARGGLMNSAGSVLKPWANMGMDAMGLP